MAKPNLSTNPQSTTTKTPLNKLLVLIVTLVPVLSSTILYQLDSFDPAPFPLHELDQPELSAPMRNGHLSRGAEFVGSGKLNAPEEIVYDGKAGVIVTGCCDGWVKRVTVNDSVSDSVVIDWVNTGGRPLGIALDRDGQVVVADAFKGLLKISEDGLVEILSQEAGGQKFKLADGVDIAEDGIIYFTDASHKYELNDVKLAILEGKPSGRLLSYDPKTRETEVLVHDLYFPNGVAVSPNQDFVVFCETPMKRCRRYYIQGEKRGVVEKFIDNLPGLPDNIHFVDGHYWIAIAVEASNLWEFAARFPFVRKITGLMTKYIGSLNLEKNSGIFVVDPEGKPTQHYHDQGLAYLSSGLKIGNYLYCGSVIYPHITRVDLAKYPALPIA